MDDHYTTILYDVASAPVARITLNRPEKRNPIGPATCGELVHALGRARQDETVRVVLLTGAGAMFSAGGDLSGMQGKDRQRQTATLVELFQTMHGLQKPIVAMVNGHALAGGLGLVAACDLAIASEEAELGTTEILVGLWPMIISAEIVRSIGRKRALELFATGRRIRAAEAERIGLVNRVVPPAELEATTMSLCHELAAKSPTAMRLGLAAFYQTQDMDMRSALWHLERQLMAILATEDAAEGIAAFLAKRAPVWKGR